MVVDEPSLVGVHWLQFQGFSLRNDPGGEFFRLFDETEIAVRPEVFDVDENPGGRPGCVR